MLDTKKMYSYIKQKGYTYSKDQLGTYFDAHAIKFSIIKTGLWYTCYHNIKVDGNWHLAGKSGIYEDFAQSLAWIIKEIEKSN